MGGKYACREMVSGLSHIQLGVSQFCLYIATKSSVFMQGLGLCLESPTYLL